jgi:serine/threonine-protein kinase
MAADSLCCPFCRGLFSGPDDDDPRCPHCQIDFRRIDPTDPVLHLSLPAVTPTLTNVVPNVSRVDLHDPDPLHPVEPAVPGESPRPEDDRVPPGYDLLGLLGRGGMGVVYQARHRKLRRVVALKMILTGEAATPAERERFETEAQTIARCQHPGILQIFEVGEHNGHAFMALELCPGGSLAARLRLQPPPPREVAELVRRLALALQAAHDVGVLHRDLKPANVLIAADGTPKIADFGLARKLGEQGQTQTGRLVGTPPYMSPEQARGEKELGPATDVWALGAILYECLTGKPPFKAATAWQTIFQIQKYDPVAVRELNPAVPADLETICHKCLRKELAQRYASARALADDLGNFLAGRPIQARPLGLVERGYRWVKRHRVVAALLALVVVVLTAGVVGLSIGLAVVTNLNQKLTQSNQEKDRALEQEKIAREAEGIALLKERSAREDAQKTIEDMTSEAALKFLQTQKELRPEQKEFLEKALDYYQRRAQAAATDETERARQARAYFQMGFLQERLKLVAAAQGSYEKALPLQQKLIDDFPRVPRYRTALAITHNNLGLLLHDLGDFPAARTQHEQTLALYQKLADEFPEVSDYHQLLARSHNNLSIVLIALGLHPAAQKELEQALALHQNLVDSSPDEPLYRHDLARCHGNVGALLRARGDRWGARKQYEQAQILFQKLADDFPALPEYRQDLARGHLNLGLILTDLDDHRGARKQHEQANILFQNLADEFPSQPQFGLELAASHTNLGNALRELSDWTGARKQYEQAILVIQKLVDALPRVPQYRQELARSHGYLGLLLSRLNEPAAARKEQEKALALQQKLADEFPKVHQYRMEVAITHNNLGLAFSQLNDGPAARKEYELAVAMKQKLADDYPARTDYALELGGSLCNLASLTQQDTPLAALELYDRARAVLTVVFTRQPTDGDTRLYLRNTFWGRAATLDALGRYPEALADWDETLKLESGPRERTLFQALRRRTAVKEALSRDLIWPLLWGRPIY